MATSEGQTGGLGHSNCAKRTMGRVIGLMSVCVYFCRNMTEDSVFHPVLFNSVNKWTLEKCTDAYYSNSEIKNLERIINMLDKETGIKNNFRRLEY